MIASGRTAAGEPKELLVESDGTLNAKVSALADGTQKAITRGGAKGATTAADITSTAVDTDHQALDVAEAFAPAYEDGTNAVAAVVPRKLAVSTYAPSLFANRAANATLNVKASPGNVYAVTCHNINAAVRYLQLHNTGTTPGGGAVPLLEFRVPATSDIRVGEEFFTEAGIHFSAGIAFAFSTTAGTYTAGTATDQHTQVVFK